MSKKGSKKKEDFIQTIFNVKEYTKNLKKNASNLQDKNANPNIYSQDEIKTYSDEIHYPLTNQPHSFIDSQFPSRYDSRQGPHYLRSKHHLKEQKSRKSHKLAVQKSFFQSGDPMAQSGSDFRQFSPLPLRIKKNSLYQYQNSKKGMIAPQKKQPFEKNYESQIIKYNDDDLLHKSLGRRKGDRMTLKLKSRINLEHGHNIFMQQNSDQNYSPQKINATPRRRQQTSSQIYSHYQNDYESESLRKHRNKESEINLPKVQTFEQSRFVFSQNNFHKLIAKIEQQQFIISLYKNSIKALNDKIKLLTKEQAEYAMKDHLIDTLKQDVANQKQLLILQKQKVAEKDRQINEYELTLLKTVQKISNHYEGQTKKIAGLKKQNRFLLEMLSLKSRQQNNDQISSEEETENENDCKGKTKTTGRQQTISNGSNPQLLTMKDNSNRKSLFQTSFNQKDFKAKINDKISLKQV